MGAAHRPKMHPLRLHLLRHDSIVPVHGPSSTHPCLREAQCIRHALCSFDHCPVDRTELFVASVTIALGTIAPRMIPSISDDGSDADSDDFADLHNKFAFENAAKNIVDGFLRLQSNWRALKKGHVVHFEHRQILLMLFVAFAISRMVAHVEAHAFAAQVISTTTVKFLELQLLARSFGIFFTELIRVLGEPISANETATGRWKRKMTWRLSLVEFWVVAFAWPWLSKEVWSICVIVMLEDLHALRRISMCMWWRGTSDVER